MLFSFSLSCDKATNVLHRQASRVSILNDRIKLKGEMKHKDRLIILSHVLLVELFLHENPKNTLITAIVLP